jgi:hypothetical protein
MLRALIKQNVWPIIPSLETTYANLGVVRNQPQAPLSLTRYPVNMRLDKPISMCCVAVPGLAMYQTKDMTE